MKKLIILAICLLTITCVAKSKPSLKKADNYFEKLDYQKAKDEYTRLLRGKRTSNIIYLQLAICYDKLGESVQAAKFYAKSLENDSSLNAEINYRLAYNLQKSGRYEAAKAEMKKFAFKEPSNRKSVYFFEHKDENPLNLPESAYFIEESGLNDANYNSYNITLAQSDTVLFVSNRTKYENKLFRKWFEVKDKITKKPNTDIYEAIVTTKNDPTYESIHLKGPINRRFNEGQAVMHSKKQLIYFSSESYRNKKFRKNPTVQKREAVMSLFLAVRKGKKWKKIKTLSFVEAGFTYVDPFVSSDGKYLYYASNQEGSYGDLDIWRVEILEDGFAFGKPENIGNQINTGFVERAPFITTDQIMYFTSDRWGGFGGLDIYSLDLKDSNAKPINMGKGINTAKDEINFVYNTKRNFGFLSSDRIGRKDIYKVKPHCLKELKISVLDEQTKEQIADVMIEITDVNHYVLYADRSNKEGEFTVSLTCKKLVKASFQKEGYYYKELNNLVGQSIEDEMIVYLKPKPPLAIQEDRIILNDISFVFNGSDISEKSKFELDKLVQFMKANPKMRIKIISHTDNVGNETYNLFLSEKRAKNTSKYLEDNGIDASRIEAIGVGSAEPKIFCKDCSEEENQENRRSEFIILLRFN